MAQLETKDLREKRARLAQEAGEILTVAAKDGREQLRSDETEKWEVLHRDIDAIGKQIDMRDRQAELEGRLEESQGRRSEPNPVADEKRTAGSNGSNGAGPAMQRLRLGQQDSAEALRSWLLAGSDRQLTDGNRAAAQRAGVDLRQPNLNLKLSPLALRDINQIDKWEVRAQSVGVDTAGGFLVPDETIRAIEVAMLEFGGMRRVSTVIRTETGGDLPVPTVNDTANEGAILGENTAATELAVEFAQQVLQAFKYSSRMILVSAELLQDAAINVPELLGRLLGERIGRITNRHFTVGTGTNQPRGVVTAATLGKTGITAQTGTVLYDDLVDLEHSVDPAYRNAGARFMFHDSTLKILKKLLDGNDRPLWQPGLAGFGPGQPDTILGYPYVINQHMATPAASEKTILFGDFTKYWIRDVREINLRRLDERFAEYNQVAFLAFSRHDGDLIDAGTHPIKYFQHPAA